MCRGLNINKALQQWAPTLALVTDPKDRKRPVGTPTKVVEHRQLDSGTKAQAAGYQLKKGVVAPLYLTEPEPGQAVEIAVRAIHPFSQPLELSPAVEANLEAVCMEPDDTAMMRLSALRHWQERAEALLPDSVAEIRALPDAHLRRLLLGCEDSGTPELGKVTHLALWREMLEAAGCPDKALVEQMTHGFNIVGTLGRSCRWGPLPARKSKVYAQKFVSVNALRRRAWGHRNKVLKHIQKAKVTEHSKEIWDSTMEDVKEGSSVGPFHSFEEVEKHLKQFGDASDWILTQRFEVVQKNKVRGCDSATINDVNNAVVIKEKLELPSTDLNVATIRKLRTLLKRGRKKRGVRGWVLDERKAYRQIPVRPDNRKWSVIGFKHHETGKPVFFVMIGHSFGLVSAVYNYNRRSAAINDILEKIFKLVAFSFYDDKYGFEPEDTVELAKFTAERVHFMLGVTFDEKKLQLADDPVILGVTYDLANMVLLLKPSRKEDLLAELKGIQKAGILSGGDAGKLKGKLMFGASQLWGKVGRAFLRALSQRQYGKNEGQARDERGPSTTPALDFAIQQWIKLIQDGPPRSIDDVSPRPSDVVIFTDGYTPDWRFKESGPSRIGGVLFDRLVKDPIQFTSDVPESVIEKWIPRKTQIVMVELVAAVLVLTNFANQLRCKHVLLLIDSEAVEGALIKGYSGTEDVCELVGLFWDLAAKLRCLIYIDRVPTDANPADYPSRNKMEIGQRLGWKTAKVFWPKEII